MIFCKPCLAGAALTMMALIADGAEPLCPDPGPRQATVAITADADAYRLNVSFVPATLFDAAKNARLNFSQAKMYALAALGRKLKVETGLALTVSDLKLDNCRTEAGRFLCSVHIPLRSVRVVAGAAALESSSNCFIPGTPDLLDHQASLKRLLVANWQDWKTKIEQTPATPAAAENLSGIEDEISAELDRDRLRQKLEADVLLLQDDVAELQRFAEKLKSDLLLRCTIRLMEANLQTGAVRNKAEYQLEINARQSQTINAETP